MAPLGLIGWALFVIVGVTLIVLLYVDSRSGDFPN